MAIHGRMKFGLCLAAVFLLGATQAAPCLAEEAKPTVSGEAAGQRSAGQGVAEPRHSVEPLTQNGAGGRSKSDGSKSDEHPRPQADGAVEIPATTGPVQQSNAGTSIADTQVEVPPRRLSRWPGGVGEVRALKPIMPRLLARPSPTSRPTTPVRQNAIGVPLAGRSAPEPRFGERRDLSGVARGTSATPPGISTAVLGGAVKTESQTVRPTRGANPTLKFTPASRGSINGAAIARPGATPSTIGGPAKTVAGINGSTIRPKF